MNTKLDGMQVKVLDLEVQSHDVFIDFEYEKLNSGEIKFFLQAKVGKNLNEYRFSLKTIHIINFEDEVISNEKDIVQRIIDEILEGIIDMICTIDNFIKPEKERLN